MGTEQDKQRALEKAVDDFREKLINYRTYMEDEQFTFNGKPVLSVLDYWRFLHSNLDANMERIAEFLVAMALGISKAENTKYWTAYDMTYKSKRIEIKSSCYVHPFNRKISNQRVFSIAPSSNFYWYGRLDRNGKAKARQNEIYVFCLNNNRVIGQADPLVIDHWDFYVVPTFVIDSLCTRRGNAEQKTISLGVIQRFAKPVKWQHLKQTVDDAIVTIDEHVKELDSRLEDYHGQWARAGKAKAEAETKESTE